MNKETLKTGNFYNNGIQEYERQLSRLKYWSEKESILCIGDHVGEQERVYIGIENQNAVLGLLIALKEKELKAYKEEFEAL